MVTLVMHQTDISEIRWIEDPARQCITGPRLVRLGLDLGVVVLPVTIFHLRHMQGFVTEISKFEGFYIQGFSRGFDTRDRLQSSCGYSSRLQLFIREHDRGSSELESLHR